MLIVLRAVGLFAVTAVAEILGCYLTYLWLRQGKPVLVLVPAALSLGAFAWLLTFHPAAAGRTYAAYGGIYVATSILWLWLVEGQTPSRLDLVGAAIAIAGMIVIVLGSER